MINEQPCNQILQRTVSNSPWVMSFFSLAGGNRHYSWPWVNSGHCFLYPRQRVFSWSQASPIPASATRDKGRRPLRPCPASWSWAPVGLAGCICWPGGSGITPWGDRTSATVRTFDLWLSPPPILFASGCSPSPEQTPVCFLSGLTLPSDNGSRPNWAVPKDEVGDGVGSLLLEAGWWSWETFIFEWSQV